MIYKKKIPFSVYLVLLIPILLLFFVASGIFSYQDLSLLNAGEKLTLVFRRIYKPWTYANEKTVPCLAIGLTVWIFLVSYLSLVITDFRRRVNKRGEEYGMPVSIMFPPEKVWGYDKITSAYSEKPEESWQRIYDRTRELYPDADEKSVVKLIGKKPQ